jgi:hypothetical protein
LVIAAVVGLVRREHIRERHAQFGGWYGESAQIYVTAAAAFHHPCHQPGVQVQQR